MKIAILYICTGKYNRFFKGFYESCEKYFMAGVAEKHYFVWTDDPFVPKFDNVDSIYHECRGFPADSLFRFDMFLECSDKLKNFDYIYFFNSNAEFKAPIGLEFLPDETGLVAALWPRRENQHPALYPYERNKKSAAYIEPHHPPYHYYMGGINGGSAIAYLRMIETCAANIRADYEKRIIATVHDESHINKYLHSHPCKMLRTEYCWPEEWPSDFQPKIIFRNKARIDPYFNKRWDDSLSGKIVKMALTCWRAVIWYL